MSRLSAPVYTVKEWERIFALLESFKAKQGAKP